MTSPRAAASKGCASEPADLVEHFFRHEYGRLTSVLVSRLGAAHLALIEDSVQSALMSALTAWAARGIPDSPSAWLFRVARNHALGVLRVERRRREIVSGLDESDEEAVLDPSFDGEVRDELLRMLFVCCDDAIAPEACLPLALKTLGGFSVGEIAARLFAQEATVYKRLARARARLRTSEWETDSPPLDAMAARLPTVHSVIYALFNEGYLSVRPEYGIRKELCDEALRLGALLAEHPVGATPTTFALLALMHFHAARLDARQDATGGLLLLEEQDRTRWDGQQIQAGVLWLSRAGSGEAVSRYHIEASIAAEHALATSFQATRWEDIAENYAALERMHPSPIYRLNRAVALAEARGPSAGLALLENEVPPPWLDGHYLWAGVLADLHRRAGNKEEQSRFTKQALLTAPTEAIKGALARRLTES